MSRDSPRREDVAYVLMTRDESDSRGIDVPLAVYTDAREAFKANHEYRLAGGSSGVDIVPINPHFFNREDQA